MDQFSGFSLAIVGIVVGIEILVVFLTMMGSVSERTTEIGVFRAIGFRQEQITRLVLHRGGRRRRCSPACSATRPAWR